MGISIFFLKIPPILKIEVGFSSDKNFFKFLFKIRWISLLNTNYERSFKRFAEHFFFPKYPRFWNLKSDFFPIEKLLHKTIFLANFIISELIMNKVSRDLRNIFFSSSFIIIHHHSSFIHDQEKVRRKRRPFS